MTTGEKRASPTVHLVPGPVLTLHKYLRDPNIIPILQLRTNDLPKVTKPIKWLHWDQFISKVFSNYLDIVSAHPLLSPSSPSPSAVLIKVSYDL